jgi:hypothetical protein
LPIGDFGALQSLGRLCAPISGSERGLRAGFGFRGAALLRQHEQPRHHADDDGARRTPSTALG